jgi:hypothetical protein
MRMESPVASRQVDTFEDYTLYSLERSTPALLNMMERGKRVATHWPEVSAMVNAAGLCQEVAALVSYQDTLDEVFEFSARKDAAGEQWAAMRKRMQFVMDTLEDVLALNEPGPVKRLFSVELPEALNLCIEAIPAAVRHVRENYASDASGATPLRAGENG